EQTSNHKKLIVNSSAEMESIIKNKEELRKHDLKARDNLIRNFMQYYLSVRNKFKYICQSRFKTEPELLTKEFELPLPKEDSLLERKSISDNHRCKITADMEVIRNRMSNYLSKRRHKKSVGIYREETGILIRDSYKIYTVRFKNMGNVSASDSILRNISSDEKEKIGKDIITHKSDGNSTYKIPHRSFNFISGINISPGITNVDPELVSHGDVADIILSLENKDVSKYLAAMNSFTAKFMCKSLQYIRALKVDLHNYDDSYLINPNTDEYIAQSRGIYTKLHYICDYFKYYVLGNDAEVADSLEENVSSCIEEKDCAERIELINKLLYRDERVCPNRDHVSLYGPEVDVPIMGTDKRILYARNGYSRRLTLKRLMESNDS
ncbi:hypothetical protein, partial [Candidatus Ichthyocystis sparus]|uniref:hypothetical protein n=1 Tax=Candidatus Ichthyocystis sparus TaxID=1561004 RepID=UPI00159EC68E